MEAAIRWSPGSTLTEQRFLLADSTGRTFSHAHISSYNGKQLRYDFRLHYRKTPAFRAFDWASFDESIVAVGQWSGEVTVLHIDESASPLVFPAKHQRLCNAVTFNRQGLLATGLERVRNIEGLNLWDINQRLSSSTSSKPGHGKYAEPYRKFAISEAISSVKFFNGQPDVMVVGVKGIGIRIYDLREDSFDPSVQFNNARVHNIAIDPLNENHFACSGIAKDPAIQIWDCRWNSPHDSSASTSSSPMIEFEEAFAPESPSDSIAIRSLRYCKSSSGLLGALFDGGVFKVYETSFAYSKNESNFESTKDSDPAVESVERMMTKRTHTMDRRLTDNLKSTSESGRIVSFDFTNLAGLNGRPCAIVLRDNADVSILEMSTPPAVCSPSVSGSLYVSTRVGRSAQKTTPIRINMPDGEHKTLRIGRLSAAADARSSISLTRRRCERGYALDAKHNIEVLGDDKSLQHAWRWIQRKPVLTFPDQALIFTGAFENAKEGAMTSRGLDLSYLGVYNIWKRELSRFAICNQ